MVEISPNSLYVSPFLLSRHATEGSYYAQLGNVPAPILLQENKKSPQRSEGAVRITKLFCSTLHAWPKKVTSLLALSTSQPQLHNSFGGSKEWRVGTRRLHLGNAGGMSPGSKTAAAAWVPRRREQCTFKKSCRVRYPHVPQGSIFERGSPKRMTQTHPLIEVVHLDTKPFDFGRILFHKIH